MPGSLSRNKPGMLVALLSQSLESFRNCANLPSTDMDHKIRRNRWSLSIFISNFNVVPYDKFISTRKSLVT